jgi:cyclin-dependent kinase 10
MKEANHPNICRAIEYIEDEHLHECYIVMEFIEFMSLKTIIDRHREILTEKVIKLIVKNLLLAVKHLHRKFICHRDI